LLALNPQPWILVLSQVTSTAYFYPRLERILLGQKLFPLEPVGKAVIFADRMAENKTNR